MLALLLRDHGRYQSEVSVGLLARLPGPVSHARVIDRAVHENKGSGGKNQGMVEHPTTKLFVIRHGETVWNRDERFQGHGDSPLTKKGRNQARAIGRRLQHTPFDALIASDLGRAQETATLISKYTGHPVQTDARLRERFFGVFEGLTAADIEQQYPDTYAQFFSEDPDYEIPSGESHRQHYERNIAFLEEFVREKQGTTAALVVHGGVLDSFLRYIVQLPLDRKRSFICLNASLSIVAHGIYYGTVRWVIETWGDVAHL